MSKKTLIVTGYAIAFICFVFLGHLFLNNQNTFIKKKNETHLEKSDGHAEKIVRRDSPAGTNRLNSDTAQGPPMAEPLKAESPKPENVNHPMHGTVVQKNGGHQPPQAGNNNLGAGKDPVDPLTLNSLIQKAQENDPDSIQKIITLVGHTEDNRILHTSLQALGRIGTREAHQALTNAVGKRLESPTEVVRILSYFNRSVPLDESISNQLIKYVESPVSTVETKKVILRNVMRSADGRERERAQELMRKVEKS
ncbi:MAG: HEAT repeat domain-containing protein [Desulfobacula sp.]|nr:HEAT repeat domain-containing protein [Desulfobacula sp.]